MNFAHSSQARLHRASVLEAATGAGAREGSQTIVHATLAAAFTMLAIAELAAAGWDAAVIASAMVISLAGGLATVLFGIVLDRRRRSRSLGLSQQAQSALAASERRYRVMAEASTDLIFQFGAGDKRGVFSHTDPSFLRLHRGGTRHAFAPLAAAPGGLPVRRSAPRLADQGAATSLDDLQAPS